MNKNITMLERRRIQMEYAVQLIRDLQRILGEEVVNSALLQRGEATSSAPGSKADFIRMQADTEQFAEGGALDYEVIAADTDNFDINVNRCGYSEMMEELGARDIGHLLICNLDFPAASKVGMELNRSQTKMEGGEFCDFRYRRRDTT